MYVEVIASQSSVVFLENMTGSDGVEQYSLCMSEVCLYSQTSVSRQLYALLHSHQETTA